MPERQINVRIAVFIVLVIIFYDLVIALSRRVAGAGDARMPLAGSERLEDAGERS